MNSTSLLSEFWQWLQDWQFFHQLFPLGHTHLSEDLAFQIFEEQFVIEQQAQFLIQNELYETAHRNIHIRDELNLLTFWSEEKNERLS